MLSSTTERTTHDPVLQHLFSLWHCLCGVPLTASNSTAWTGPGPRCQKDYWHYLSGMGKDGSFGGFFPGVARMINISGNSYDYVRHPC
jgi:hypothetical protein